MLSDVETLSSLKEFIRIKKDTTMTLCPFLYFMSFAMTWCRESLKSSVQTIVASLTEFAKMQILLHSIEAVFHYFLRKLHLRNFLLQS